MPRVDGQLTASGTTLQAVEATAYTEQTSGAQRSIKSASVNDTAAGTGARTVKITYYTLASDGTIAGPYYETVTLNGTTAVATVASNIALIERMDVATAGSGGVAAGAISLYTDNAGAGSVIGSIASGDVRTRWAHHYIASHTRCLLTDLHIQSGDASTNDANFYIKAQPYPATGVECDVAGAMIAMGTSPMAEYDFTPPLVIVGPARVRVYCIPSTTAKVYSANIGFSTLPSY